jgi:hypothetical protein
MLVQLPKKGMTTHFCGKMCSKDSFGGEVQIQL